MTEFVEARGLEEPVRAPFLPDEIEALVALGDLERAARLTETLAACGHRLDRPWALATSYRCRALVLGARGELAASRDAIDEALQAHERLPMPFELARTLLVQGQIERRARRKTAAKESFERALAIFEQIGMPLWAAKARADLDRVGLRRAAGNELTESERRVAELAASGLTNREVSAQLFISAKTVEATLARAYSKLGIRSRAQLGAHLAGESREPAQT